MRRSRFARRIGSVSVVIGLVAVPALAPSSGGAATPGTWGVQQATYVDGTVCRNGNVTSPLAAWNFGDAGLDFLLNTVTSDGVTDSALLPQAGSPGRLVSPISPGQYGMGSATDVSTYAALISIFGSGPDPDAARVAKAILDNAGGGATPDCVTTAAGQLLASQAARVAGPYNISATAATSPVAAGASDSLTVRVVNAFGQPAPGVAVALTSPVLIFASQGSTTARTDSTGVAHVAFSVPQDNTISTVSITATASVSVGLEAVTAGGGFGQPYASAVFADPPTAYTANVTVAVSQGAAPVLRSNLATTAIAKGATLALSEHLTGMFGHTGHVTFTISGPLKLDPTNLCTTVSAKSFGSHTRTAATSSLDVSGDSTLTGGNWQPNDIGCYLLNTLIVTTNATPQASARGPQTVLTVLDTTAAATPAHSVLRPGTAVSESVVVTHSYQRTGSLATKLLGPLAPGSGDCRTADWSKAKSSTVTPTKTKGDGTYSIATPALPTAGCYQLQSQLLLAISSHTTAHVPLSSPVVSGIFYALQPVVSATADQTSVISPATVRTSVTVQNTFGQPGHVSIQMLSVPADEFGCRHASFAGAAVVATGTAVATTGDGVVSAVSAATKKLGCYALVPKLVMDGNPAVVATGVADVDNVVLAGVGLAPPAPRAKASVGHSLLGTYITFAAFLLLLMATALAVFRYVTRVYANDGDDEDDERPSPLGSRLGSLFTPGRN